jgi:RNA 2',3'-cyclic 3'-phosphodiesterase
MSESDVRLFTAFWPDAEVAAQLARCRDAWQWSPQARPQATARLHVTLHFIGSIERSALPKWQDRLSNVEPVNAQLQLDRLELWPNGIAALCPASVPEPIEALHARLGQVLAHFDCPIERRAFRPHITLARQALGSIAPASFEPVAWHIDQHVLVESERTSGAYRLLWRSAPAHG